MSEDQNTLDLLAGLQRQITNLTQRLEAAERQIRDWQNREKGPLGSLVSPGSGV